jgi:NAD(P)-dependent dehydrogenase (short-subunit alcohol dehydrogenase family)
MTHFLIVGASRGLGDALTRTLPRAGDMAWLVSRGEPFLGNEDGATRRWLPGDLSKLDAGAAIAAQLAGRPLDVVVYNAGIWENSAWSGGYDAARVPDEETARIVQVNLTSAITLLGKLLPSLRQSENPKVILIGSISGLENVRGQEVAYGASKFGLRGVAHALREHWRAHGVGVSILNPGSFDGIGHADLVASVRYMASLSRTALVKELDLVAMGDSV